ncbi:hypothetical protein PVK62_01830 [Aliivibrio sp. S3MY1]|uniref:hypothetical protein n=1 Tax=unclassified Aliivibrio TaxID=2645654 RepID=UPI002379D899|nr:MULTISPECIES: hypothetical protein [unclassified Aliivibrio]MDD9194572.1 hypothetical protein [Aliivibrio sp. S3MY1]MDD9200593.1 hypothetical protein [Aliivibrio sp. S2MY1]
MTKYPTTENTSTLKQITLSLGRYLQQTDWIFSLILAFILRTLIFSFQISISIAVLYFQFSNIVEYQDGSADISTIEIIFFISFLILFKRYWAYSKQTSLHWWNLVISPFLWHGRFIIIALVCVVLSDSSPIENFEIISLQEQHLLQIISLSSILLSLYISVPSRTLIIKTEIKPLNTTKSEEIKIESEVKNVQ